MQPTPTTGATNPTSSTPTSATTPTSAPSTSAPSTTAATAPDPPDVEVELTDAGAEPQTVRRLVLTPGTTRTTLAQTQELVQSIDGFEGPSSGPITVVMVMDVTVEVVPGGYRLISTVVEAGPGDDVDPAVAAGLESELAAVVGLGQTIVIDDLGRPLDEPTLSFPDDMPDEIVALMSGFAFDQIVAPLPEEAVGVGATWSIEQELDNLGVTLDQRWEFELVEIDGDRLHVVGTGTQSVDPGPVELPGVPSVVTVTIVNWDGAITTDIWHDLSRPIADTTTTVEARQEFAIEDRTSTGELVQEITTTMTVTAG